MNRHKSVTGHVRDLHTAFNLVDRNRDGRVTVNELQFMLKNLGIHIKDELLNELVKEASQSGKNLINEAEFLQWIQKMQNTINDGQEDSSSQQINNRFVENDDISEDLIAAFRVFDRDGNGYITRDELQTAMDIIGEPLNDSQLTQLLVIADQDRDGRINYEEFRRLLL